MTQNGMIQQKEISSEDFLKRAYPHKEIGRFSSKTQGIYFEGMVYKTDFEKINTLGFEVEYCQPYGKENSFKSGVIVVVTERER